MKLKIKKSKPGYSYDPRKDGVSQSMIADWLNCREKSRLNLVLGLTSTASSKPFTYGSLSHGVLEAFYLSVREGEVKKVDDALHLLPQWYKFSEAMWDEEHPRAKTELLDLKEECLALLQEIMPRYIKFRWKEDTAVKWEMIEEKFSVPLKMPDGQTVCMVGRVDGLFRNRKTEQLWLLETKNKGQIAGNLLELLPLDLQLGYYLTGVAALIKEQPTRVLYNILRRPQERRGQTENLKDFALRIGQNIAKKPDHYFQRYDVKLTGVEIEEHKFRAEKLVSEFYSWWKIVDKEERDLMWNSGHCDNRYGTCGNLPICSNGDRSGHYVREAPSPELAAE